MSIGTCFYCYERKCGLYYGFYMAVNVGYCIGWSFPEDASCREMLFSMCYMFVGASSVAVTLSFFAQAMIESSKSWYVRALKEREYYAAATTSSGCKGFLTRCWLWMMWHSSLVRAVVVWCAWLISLVVSLSMMYPQWDPVRCLFFGFSALTTGGLRALPAKSPEWHFGLRE